MDEIYGDLENYNEVNALAELRSENQELKVKLEECTTSMDKLQKNILQDFDKLTTEFKKLECNYSSLLKTARAEIERKTKIIANLNIEKDVLICKTLQNGNNNVLNYKQDVARHITQLAKKEESVIGVKNKKNHKEPPTLPQHESETVRIDKLDSYCGRNSESKGNIHHDSVASTKPRALSIKDRRKSMPSVSIQEERFSSDEEYYNPAERDTEYSMKTNVHKNISDRRYNRKLTNKISESSSIDDKTSGYHESSRETYNSRNNRYYDNDKYRNRDKYDHSQRLRRDISPDRYNRRRTREYQPDNNQRLDYNSRYRDRVLLSPSKDEYNYSHRYTQGHTSNYSRTQYSEHDRYKHYQDRHSVKHKMVSDHDEPCSKRKKIDPYSNLDDTNWYEGDFPENQTMADTFEQLESQYTSCQSPDYIYTDMSEPIKEIKNTALTQLEDPRLASKKYSLKTNDDKTFLSTDNDMNIDLRRINKSMWGIKKVTVPKALLQQPTDRELKEICLSRESADANTFTDSSEISCPQDNSVNLSVTEVKNQTLKSYPVNDYKKKLSQFDLENNTQTEENLQIKLLYDLPDLKTSSGNNSELLDINRKEFPNVTDNSEEYYNNNEKYKEKTKVSKENLSRKTIADNSTAFLSNRNTNRSNNTCHDTKQINDDKSYLSTNKRLERDLELSDENCDDNTYLQKVNANTGSYNKKPHDSCSIQVNERGKEQKTFSALKEKTSETPIKTCLKKKNTPKVQKDKIVTDETIKNKKKSEKSKDELTIQSTENVEKNIVIDKKPKRKKEKVKPEEEKPKLQDLFGDNSVASLITPADLGIVSAQSTTSIYTSIFEDAQDAIELKETSLEIKNNTHTELIDPTNSENPKTDATVLSQGNDAVEPFMENDKGNAATPDDGVNSKLSAIYENLEPITNETDAVKTVIISTGCQPDISVEEEEDIKNDVDTVSQNYEQNNETVVNNLATSTPYKESFQHNTFESNSRIPDSSCNSNDSRLGNDVTNSDTLDCEKVTDVPDVRIFVRRKRKILKKPLLT